MRRIKKMAETERRSWFWGSVAMALAVRLVLIWFVDALNLGSRPEVATPLTSLRRLAEGQWLKQSSMSPYAGSMYHGSPLLLSILGPLAVKRIEGLPSHLICSLVFVSTDFIAAMLIRATGWNLHFSYNQFLGPLNLSQLQKTSGCGDFAALIYLWNPLTVVACVGSSTAPIENLMVILSLYGACTRRVPLAAFGWVVATHLSLYPAILILPVILLLGYGPDAPPKKLFKSVEQQRNPNTIGSSRRSEQPGPLVHSFSSKAVVHFILWSAIWSIYVLGLCSISLKQYGGLREMFKKTHGFILTVEDLSPNLGVLWYFFAEVFDFFRTFFLLVFHANILFMILPLAIRLKHRPCFLAFVYIAIASMLKSYPSVGDSALYLGLMSLFINELAGMRFSFFLLSGYIGVFLLSPVMHNLWIWRGTGNANFYFATALAYACLQIVLVVESVESMLNHDRMLRKQLELTATKSE